jgi:hypothetical protein
MSKVLFRCVLTAQLLLLGSYLQASAQSTAKALTALKADIAYLASDSLEGRRTATPSELKAARYIIGRYRKMGILPFGDGYIHPFPFVNGKEIGKDTKILLNNEMVSGDSLAFPLPFSANTKGRLHGDVLPDVQEQGNIWLLSLYKDQEEMKDAHFDWEKAMLDKAKEAKSGGASAVFFYDGFNSRYPPSFLAKSETETLDIPVVFLGYSAWSKYINNHPEGVTIDLEVDIQKAMKEGRNVAAYLDNGSKHTVVLGAHYDHLGYGEDGNSTYTGKEPAIHNGADDNASGTAGLLYLAGWLKTAKLKKYNYLFVHFSGEELGLYGSKAIVKELADYPDSIAYMINMDMIGRLNDSTHALTIGGVGTSPAWAAYTKPSPKKFKVALDSSGVGPSDHTSFYHAGVPVLFLFTGLHHDYHKPSDDADKINYAGEMEVLKYTTTIITDMNRKPVPAFTATKQNAIGKVRFKVTLGIMPDYSFSEGGVKVDGVIEDRPAVKAGIKAGDVITELGGYKVQGIQSYMEALGKLKSGEEVEATILRNGSLMVVKVSL